MTEGAMLAAAAEMIAVLDGENQALAALDLRAAAGLLARKRDAAERLDRLRRAPAAASPGGGKPDTPRPAASPELQAAMRRLRDLADRNKALLERGILVQERVLGVVVRAVSQAAPAPRYGARGTLARGSPAGSGGGFALTASA